MEGRFSKQRACSSSESTFRAIVTMLLTSSASFTSILRSRSSKPNVDGKALTESLASGLQKLDLRSYSNIIDCAPVQ